MISRKGADRPVRLTPPPAAAAIVLVADSDLAARARMAGMLEAQGYRVVLAAGGEEALARIRQGGIDLLVSAMVMDGMDGLELLRALRDAAITVPSIAIAPGGRDIDDIYLRGAALLGVARTYRQPLRSAAFLRDIQDLLRPGG
jgi:CheY-like chemotaxis protein